MEKHFKFDGDGRNVIQREDHDSWTMTYPKKYEVWSSVFGKPLIQYEGDWSGGQWNISVTRLNIYDANGTKIAVGPYLRWENIAPSNTAVITVNEDPLGQQIRRSELSSLGSEISFEPSEPPDENEQPESLPEMGSIESEANQICSLNGLDIQCSQVSYIMGSGECEYASCHIKDSHGDYIFDPEVEIGPASPSKSVCNGLPPEEREICYYHVRQNLDVQKKALRDKLEGAIQQESLRRLLDDIWSITNIIKIDTIEDGKNVIGAIVSKAKDKKIVKKIAEAIKYALNKKCTKAFKDAGAIPISEQRNVILVTESVFSDSKYDRYWSDNRKLGSEVRNSITGVNKGAADLGTPKQGNEYIFITNVGADGKFDYLEVTVVHSFVHSGGIRQNDNQTWFEWFVGFKPHDLRGLGKKYNKIIKECTRLGKSRVKT